MTYDEFVGQVQHRARLGSEGEAVRIIRSTLETLGERLFGGASGNLASQLPQEIGIFLTEPIPSEAYGVDEFMQRVSAREGGTDIPAVWFHVRAVMSVVCDAVSPGTIRHIRDQLSSDYNQLFEWQGRRTAA
ncbi:MAG: DUF2267 domain-containing protein [Chloroflexota bacterium]|nr:MAG: DUF2267 domain-containing protein [Chloroflexota bacterium]